MKKLAMIVFSLAILTIACRIFGVKEVPTMSATPQYSIEDAERIARIKIPAEAYEIQVYTVTGWMDDAALIKFKLPSNKLQPFLDEYGFQVEKGYWPFQDGPSVEWWPNRKEDGEPPISNYLGGELDFPGYVQKIVVDISNPDVYTVYLECFEV
jgi:hypothetical protein